MFFKAKKRAIGLVANKENAKTAVQNLRDSGFSKEQISLIGPNSCGYECQKEFELSPVTNNALISGLAVPDVGSVFTTGGLANILANNAVGFLNKGLTGALVSLGIPEMVAQYYSDCLSNGDFILLVDGTEEELDKAESLLAPIPIQAWKVYHQLADAVSR